MTRTIAQALARATGLLSPVSGDMARREVSILLAHVLGRDVSAMMLDSDQILTADQLDRFNANVSARQSLQPVSQIIGLRAFWDHEFIVTPDVLDPRPETELLVELALRHKSARTVLDLGTGSGCILCSVLAAAPQMRGLGVDTSQKALDVAARNAARTGVADRAEFRQSDWFEYVDGRFDLILSNPPYVTLDEFRDLESGVRNWEPRQALTDDGDGLDAYRKIASQLQNFLTPQGAAYFEHGATQSADVCAIFHAQGYENVKVFKDLSGKDRAVGVGAVIE